MNYTFRSPSMLFCMVLLSLGIISCGTSKKAQREILYLQGNLDTLPNRTVLEKEVTIQKGDVLGITVYSDNLEASAAYNQAVITTSAGSLPIGYVVNHQGNIRFQSLGELKVEGLTKQQLTQQLSEKLSVYLRNPYIDIRFLNFRVSVIGEVIRPAVYNIPQERLTILELIALAGDLTLYGKRDNILVVREENGKRTFGRVDLRDPLIFQSPYFYIQQNDVVMVEPSRKKPQASEQTTLRNITLASTLVSTLAILITLFRN